MQTIILAQGYTQMKIVDHIKTFALVAHLQKVPLGVSVGTNGPVYHVPQTDAEIYARRIMDHGQ